MIRCDCGSGEDIAVCECKNACRGPSYVGDDIREVFRHAATRCGKPGKHDTLLGRMCDACMVRLKAAREDPNTLGSIIREVLDEKRKRKN